MPYWFDGNNLIGQSAAVAREDPRARRAFLSTLSAFRKSGGGRFLVYFDGDDPNHSTPTGIAVKHSAPLSTDEAIICRLHEIQYPGEVIVVSNDRELTTRCRNAGAAALNWQEFTLKMESRRVRQNMKSDTQQAVDVEDWMRYFGLDKTKI